MAAKPMTGQAFFVLTALADGPRHGYGIVGEVAELSQGRVKLKIGSLYGVLERLAAEGLIEPDREEAHDGRLRRYYRLTQDGRRALAEEAELRAATARVVRARLGLTGDAGSRMSGDLERRYRRVLRLLPGWYRQQWEEDMVAAFLDSWLTGDPEADEYISRAAGPSWAEVASVAGLAVRLYLGGPGTPRRYAWGQAIRRAVLAVLLVHAVLAVNVLVFLVWSRRLVGWLPAPPGSLVVAPGGVWDTVYYLVSVTWIAIFVTLALGHYRTARVLAALAIVPGLVALVQAQLTGIMPAPFGPWVFWVLVDLAPVLAMTAFHRDAPPAAPGPWLLALPAGYVLVYGPLLALQATGNSAWLPDFSGLCCILVSLACLAHAPRAWSRQAAGTGLWSLTLVLLAAVAAAYRIVTLTDYLNDPHLINVSLAELLIMLAAVALVAPDAARAQTATPAPPPYPHAMAA